MGRLLGGEHASTPEWGGSSSPVKTEPPQIVLLLLLLLLLLWLLCCCCCCCCRRCGCCCCCVVVVACCVWLCVAVCVVCCVLCGVLCVVCCVWCVVCGVLWCGVVVVWCCCDRALDNEREHHGEQDKNRPQDLSKHVEKIGNSYQSLRRLAVPCIHCQTKSEEYGTPPEVISQSKPRTVLLRQKQNRISDCQIQGAYKPRRIVTSIRDGSCAETQTGASESSSSSASFCSSSSFPSSSKQFWHHEAATATTGESPRTRETLHLLHQQLLLAGQHCLQLLLLLHRRGLEEEAHHWSTGKPRAPQPVTARAPSGRVFWARGPTFGTSSSTSLGTSTR